MERFNEEKWAIAKAELEKKHPDYFIEKGSIEKIFKIIDTSYDTFYTKKIIVDETVPPLIARDVNDAFKASTNY